MSNIIRLPGLIDIHVHLRDPGETHKEDFYTGTCAALAGGITAVFDMPNNLEPVFSFEKLIEKINIAKRKAVCDFGLYFGSIGDNTDQFEKVINKVVGLKIYLSLTTGKYVLADEDKLEVIFQKWPKEKIIIVHAEGNRVDLVIKLAEKFRNKIHITHVVTKESLGKILEAKKNKLNITCDTTPHYLFFTIDDLHKLKGLGIVKPPLATKKDQNYLWTHLAQIDCLCSDHAPHTLIEKQAAIPPAGMPGLETLLPLMVKEISTDEIIRLTNISPRKIFGIIQDRKTYVEIDMDETYKIKREDLYSRSGWSPFENWVGTGRVKKVVIRGETVFSNGKILVSPGFGRNVMQ